MHWQSTSTYATFFPEGCSIRHVPLKRIFDICFSAAFLCASAPLLALLALGVKCSSPGPVIYSQERVGRGGKVFLCMKFRSMFIDADQKLKELLASDPELKKEYEKTHKLKRDPRITVFGRFLRKSSLDELPQFWHVLWGDLSVVGPRAYMKHEIANLVAKNISLSGLAARILSVRPGITGVWQTSGRSHISYEDRIRMEADYVDRQSMFYDLFLILKTIPAVLTGKGAY